MVFAGLLALTVSFYALPLSLLPAGIFSHFMTVYEGTARGRVFLLLSLFWLVFMLAFWSVGVFAYLSPQPFFAVAAACAPLQLWSLRDRDNIFVGTLVLAAQVGILIICAAGLGFWAALIAQTGLLTLVSYGVNRISRPSR